VFVIQWFGWLNCSRGRPNVNHRGDGQQCDRVHESGIELIISIRGTDVIRGTEKALHRERQSQRVEYSKVFSETLRRLEEFSLLPYEHQQHEAQPEENVADVADDVVPRGKVDLPVRERMRALVVIVTEVGLPDHGHIGICDHQNLNGRNEIKQRLNDYEPHRLLARRVEILLLCRYRFRQYTPSIGCIPLLR